MALGPQAPAQVRTPEELALVTRRELAQDRRSEKHGTAFYGCIVGRNSEDWQEVASYFGRPGQQVLFTDELRDVLSALQDSHALLCVQLGLDPVATTIEAAQQAMLERVTGARGAEGWAELTKRLGLPGAEAGELSP